MKNKNNYDILLNIKWSNYYYIYKKKRLKAKSFRCNGFHRLSYRIKHAAFV